MRKLISFIFLFSITGLLFAEKKADVFVRELKLRFLDSETGVPVKGLKVYNIITTEKLVYSYFFGIPSLCIGGKSYDLNHFAEHFCYDLPFQTKNGYYIKYKSFEHSPETIEIKIQQRQMGPLLSEKVLNED